MADNLPTIWKADPHTFAKHEILKIYLQKWSAILSNYIKDRKKSLLFVDGFAGPGIYEGGEDGSPTLALKTVLHHSQKFPTPIDFLFIEEDIERHEVLHAILENLKEQIDKSDKISKVELHLGECEEILSNRIISAEAKDKGFGPALVFLDQFGYSDVSLELIALIMKHKMCEVFSFLHWDSINRFYEDNRKWDAISMAYGSDIWKNVFSLPHAERATFMLNLYIDSLRKSGEAKFV
jgi:three-Cys-motif partner protein